VRWPPEHVATPGLGKDAVRSYTGLTSLALNRFSMLNPSAMISALQRSLMGILRATRRSIWKKFGRVNAFRPKFPMQPQYGRVLGNENGAPVLSTQ